MCYVQVLMYSMMFQRRRSTEDEQSMRLYLKEGDLISAEVQSVYSDGSLSLHTRSLKYGKVGHTRKIWKFIILKIYNTLE